MTSPITYMGRGLWLAECPYCAWSHDGDSLHRSWVEWRLHDKQEHA